jgi:hypothetical protein
MTLNQFRAAFSAIQMAISYPRDRKPPTLSIATRGFAQGTGAREGDIERLCKLTAEELFDLRYKLEAEYAKGD